MQFLRNVLHKNAHKKNYIRVSDPVFLHLHLQSKPKALNLSALIALYLSSPAVYFDNNSESLRTFSIGDIPRCKPTLTL